MGAFYQGWRGRELVEVKPGVQANLTGSSSERPDFVMSTIGLGFDPAGQAMVPSSDERIFFFGDDSGLFMVFFPLQWKYQNLKTNS